MNEMKNGMVLQLYRIDKKTNWKILKTNTKKTQKENERTNINFCFAKNKHRRSFSRPQNPCCSSSIWKSIRSNQYRVMNIVQFEKKNEFRRSRKTKSN